MKWRGRKQLPIRASWASVSFLMLVLLALVAMPIVIQQRIDSLREQRSEIADPARELIGIIQLSLAYEMSALRGFVITEDESFLETYEVALEEELEAYGDLEPLAHTLGPEQASLFGALRVLASRWHGRVTEAEIIDRQLVPEAFIERIQSEQILYEEALDAALALRSSIVEWVEVQRERIEDLERLQIATTVLLVLLALLAAFVITNLGRSIARFAEVADTRRHEVEEIMRSRSYLIRGTTHDLKNPIAAAAGYLQMLEIGEMGELPPDQLQLVRRARRSLGAAAKMIENMLRLAQAEAGTMEIVRKPTDVTKLVREVVEEQSSAAEAASLKLKAELAEDLPEVSTDGDRIREILRNLLSNAVKYAAEGDLVLIRALLRAGGNAPGPESWIALDVIDQGPGIPRADRERIFEEFSRLRPSDHEGTGLGLAISRRIARLLGGDITVESGPAGGSVFTLWIPLEEARRST